MAIRVTHHDGGVYDGSKTRLPFAALTGAANVALRSRGGVKYTDGNDFATTISAPNAITAAGVVIVPGATLGQGCYTVESDANVSLPLGTPHASLSRIDTVFARVRDNTFDSSGFNDATIEYIQGTAASSPVPPTLDAPPATVLRLNNILVPPSPGVATVLDVRPWAAALGGVVRVLSTALPTDVPKGTFVYELDTGKAKLWNGSAWKTVYDPNPPSWTAISLNAGYSSVSGFACEYLVMPFDSKTMVSLRGEVQKTSGLISGQITPVATLPVGVRPTGRDMVFSVSGTYDAAQLGGLVQADTDGTLKAWATADHPIQWLGLNGCFWWL